MIRTLAAAVFLGLAAAAQVVAMPSSQGDLKVTKVASDLDEPWGLAFLPGGAFLVTERDGRMLHFTPDGRVFDLFGLPEIEVDGQGGLLDVMVPRNFDTSREVYFSFSIPQGLRSGTALGVGRLAETGDALEDVRVIFEAAPVGRGGRHFGSRVVEAPDGTIFLTIGDRGDDDSAQNRSNHNGSIIRVNRDGSVPSDNPFLGISDIRAEIWSYGHRNPQGATLDLQGNLLVAEHGARGGDEVNLIRKGANYGWPVISYGRHYSGLKIGEGTSKPGMEQPLHFWDPSIAPSGIMVYSGKLWPEWRGSVFVGSLKFDYIARLDGAPLREVERIGGPETGRVRDIREAPDGSIWFLSVNEGAIFRLSPG